MDLKFSFNGGSSDGDAHDHGHATGAPAAQGIPLPFTTGPSSTSSVLEIQVRREPAALVAEAVSGDGVTYARAHVADSGGVLAGTVRSAISRAVAELEGPLSEAVTGITITVGDEGPDVIATLFPTARESENGAVEFVTDDAFQRRTGVSAGTPVTLASA